MALKMAATASTDELLDTARHHRHTAHSVCSPYLRRVQQGGPSLATGRSLRRHSGASRATLSRAARERRSGRRGAEGRRSPAGRCVRWGRRNRSGRRRPDRRRPSARRSPQRRRVPCGRRRASIRHSASGQQSAGGRCSSPMGRWRSLGSTGRPQPIGGTAARWVAGSMMSSQSVGLRAPKVPFDGSGG